jgi:hypothetical protein
MEISEVVEMGFWRQFCNLDKLNVKENPRMKLKGKKNYI